MLISFLYLCSPKKFLGKVPMEILFKNTAVEGQEQGGEKPASDLGACLQDAHEDTVYEALMRRMADRCRMMESYAQAEPLLMEVMMMAVKDGGATGLMVEMVDGVRNFFAEKNKPKPATVYKDCTIVQGNEQRVEGTYMDVHDNGEVGNHLRN